MSLLTEQYRMHPAIAAWPGAYFYDGLLADGAAVRGGGRAAGFHGRACFPPLAIFDCRCCPEFASRPAAGPADIPPS